MTSRPDPLDELAAAHGVAVRYEGSDRRPVEVDRDVVVAVLAQLGVDASDDVAIDAALAEIGPSGGLPPTVVLIAGRTRPLDGPARIELEDGSTRDLAGGLPADLPLGRHRLRTADRKVWLLVVPERLADVPRTWGWMIQLYALHSERSWGIGDYGDLAEIARRSATEQGAGVALVSPVQAIAPVTPIQRSPYSPASRRFANVLHLRVTDTAAYAHADDALRARVDALAPAATDQIDHEAVWAAKRAALELLWPLAPADERTAPDAALAQFATYSALAEIHGADWATWPDDLRDPTSVAVARAAEELADRMAFHVWLQVLCEQQLTVAREVACTGGMPVGLVHDLPVGVAAGGPDTWADQSAFATAVRVGAPPDAFNELGQDWGLPPWRPQALAEAGYAPLAEVVRSVLRHADGIRIDHVAGLWRLWWIPPGEPASRGTYVSYDAEAMVGTILLEAHRAGAIVVGEDLGTVEPVVTETMQARGMLSSAVLWFERDWDAPGQPHRRPQDWATDTMASITTHDLPTAAGWLAAEHVRLRASLGLLDGSEDDALARAEADRAALLDLLAAEGLATDDEAGLVVALHTLIARAAARLVLTSPADALGDVRQPNLPGTIDEYPNWRLPLPATLDELFADPRVAAAVAGLRAARPV